jgi:hypothetical protein
MGGVNINFPTEPFNAPHQLCSGSPPAKSGPTGSSFSLSCFSTQSFNGTDQLMLGFDVSERTISRWTRKAPRDPEPAKRWLAFLRNHRGAIAAMDSFTVPTITFGVVYCFFVIGHGRRRILHFNVTRHPTSLWVVQQLQRSLTV